MLILFLYLFFRDISLPIKKRKNDLGLQETVGYGTSHHNSPENHHQQPMRGPWHQKAKWAQSLITAQ